MSVIGASGFLGDCSSRGDFNSVRNAHGHDAIEGAAVPAFNAQRPWPIATVAQNRLCHLTSFATGESWTSAVWRRSDCQIPEKLGGASGLEPGTR